MSPRPGGSSAFQRPGQEVAALPLGGALNGPLYPWGTVARTEEQAGSLAAVPGGESSVCLRARLCETRPGPGTAQNKGQALWGGGSPLEPLLGTTPTRARAGHGPWEPAVASWDVIRGLTLRLKPGLWNPPWGVVTRPGPCPLPARDSNCPAQVATVSEHSPSAPQDLGQLSRGKQELGRACLPPLTVR